MTRRKSYLPRRSALPTAVLAGLLLAGCSSGHIGDSWQCPLATGGACDSVAAADPAVPDAGAGRKTMLGDPLWRQRAGAPGKPGAAPCETDCGGFDPFGWLKRLFGAGEKDEPAAPAAASPGAWPPAEPKSPAGEAADPVGQAERETAGPASAALPAEPVSAEYDPGGDGLRGDDLRTGEVVARIWIAPFVDTNGVYREASHVRVILEPAGWRLR
ncbi:MAG: TraV family lipoprotein [Rhodospirillaceae bacterium]|nr:TraV family lipoprotein [Rhodospirillaceae bacterium]